MHSCNLTQVGGVISLLFSIDSEKDVDQTKYRNKLKLEMEIKLMSTTFTILTFERQSCFTCNVFVLFMFNIKGEQEYKVFLNSKSRITEL